MRRVILMGILLMAGCPDNPSNNGQDMAVAGDLAMECVTDGTKCGAGGLCKSGACATCTDMTDDAACTTAHGSTSNPYYCASGVCTAGCRTSAQCNGKLCGVTTANQCGSCSGPMADVQCQMLVNTGTICEISTGNCVTAVCTSVGARCAANPADLCCPAGSPGGNLCVTGDCCSNTDCGDGGKVCVDNVCTNCPAPSGNTVYVDPTETNPGTTPTGADVPGCRYRTITAAATAVGTPAVATTIVVRGTATITGQKMGMCNNANVECFPITVAANVTITGDVAMPPTINVPAEATGFLMSAGGAALSRMTLDGLD